MKDILLLTHSNESSTGSVLDWCVSRKLTYDISAAPDLFSGTEEKQLPYRGLIIFGGDMEVWETEKYPWLLNEKRAIKKCIARRTGIFGICLGSQLLAEAFGAKVLPMNEWEFGWYPVTSETHRHLIPLHCHSSYFDLPAGAQREASNEFDHTQGFSHGDKYLGFQFHTEINAARLRQVIKSLDQATSSKIQSKEEIEQGFLKHGDALRVWCFSQLDRWLYAVKSEQS